MLLSPASILTPPILEATALSRHYTMKKRFFQKETVIKAVDQVSFKLYSGQILAVVGESGSGKSTLARLLLQMEKPTEGAFFFKNTDVTHLTGSEQMSFRKKVRMIFQNPYGSLNPRWRIFDILEEPLKLSTMLSAGERQDKIYAVLKKVGLSSDLVLRYPHMFSGGQRQRVAIARALILNPEIIIADEPTSALDVSIQAQILNLLLDLQQEFGVAYLFISHALGVVRYMADSLLVMYFGKAAEYGDAAIIFNHPRHPYTKGLLESTPVLHTKTTPRIFPKILRGELPSPFHPPSGCVFHTRCPLVIPICKTQEPVLRSMSGCWVACHRAEEM